MKKVLSGVIFSALISVPAIAADYKAPPPPAAPLYGWTGFYLGANIGSGWTNATTYTFADPGNAAFNSCGVCTLPYQPEALSDGRKSGLVGGLHLGFNWQFSPMLVAGVEGDFSEADLKKSVNAPL